jgi:hypothetical protein
MEPASGVKTWQWVVTAIVIIVLIIIGIMVFGGKDTVAPIDGVDGNATSTGSTSQGVNRIVMSAEQYPGNVVYFSSVQMAKPGWVVIHKDNNGQPGDIIGSQYFEAGINPGRVNLTSVTVEGGRYYAMLHSDDGDKIFDATKDLPLKDARGSIIMQIFNAAASVGAGFKG